ncbi:uncharacterized protein si:dkey-63d15.12 [Danio rerio]|uniref:Uncharacterized protein si:dkey-63d15.12 n=8 Tax=Danio rerio TaxID=7955 RepID=A0AC58GBH2_DANRE|nr:uncharacterized protein si:dkey-63d15.12 [Danio rerio]|eukprot:XP_017213004.1 uncharacterized protein si:dkey-63d15.12 [Danio rerio]
MTRSRLSALILTICFTGLFSRDAFSFHLPISVWQTPNITAKEGTNVSITCHINADSRVDRILVKWWQDNQTEVRSEGITSPNRLSVNGFVFINSTLDLLSVHSNHSFVYYCSAQLDLPELGPVEYGKGTHVFVESAQVTVEDSGNLHSNTVMWSLFSGLGLVVLIICIACGIHISFKGHSKMEPGTKHGIVAANSESPGSDTTERVIYTALNIPQDSVKSRNENCAAAALTSESCTEITVTYSEVHIKKRQKDE